MYAVGVNSSTWSTNLLGGVPIDIAIGQLWQPEQQPWERVPLGVPIRQVMTSVKGTIVPFLAAPIPHNS